MNKKLIIGALVGALIIFIWQFLSWAALDLHVSNMQHTPNQDKILSAMEGMTDGSYYIPRLSTDASAADQEAFMAKQTGKPWALVSYHKAFNVSMPMNMIRGFTVDFVALLMLCWLLLKIDRLDFKTALLASLAVGFIGYFTIHYIEHIWFEANTIPELIDTVAQWGLCGAWLGYYLPRS